MQVTIFLTWSRLSLPLVKPAELQQKVYQLLTEASASFSANQAKLSAAVRRVQELNEQIDENAEELDESQVSIQEISEEEAANNSCKRRSQ